MKVTFTKLLTTLAFSWFTVTMTIAESPDKEVSVQSSKTFLFGSVPANTGSNYNVIVFNDAGWTVAEIDRITREANAIYTLECHYNLTVDSIHFINVDKRLHQLDELLQEQLLGELSDVKRPMVFFINKTTENDFAFAYLPGTESPGQGTAWLSRQSSKDCRGPLLAHELGHILLGVSNHSLQPKNLMAESCRHSNVSNNAVNTSLTAQQCQLLWNNDTQNRYK